MATLREFILNQSTLPTGNIVRDHIQNPGTGGEGPSGLVYIEALEIEFMASEIDVEVAESPVEVEVASDSVELEVVNDPIEVEVD